jgi:hypothetical protein
MLSNEQRQQEITSILLNFLQKSFVEELTEKWPFCTKSANGHVTATYGPSATLEHTVTRVFADLPQIRHFWS